MKLHDIPRQDREGGLYPRDQWPVPITYLHLNGVATNRQPDGTTDCEMLDPSEGGTPEFYSIYAHTPIDRHQPDDEECLVIGDFETAELGRAALADLADELAVWGNDQTR